MRRDRHRTRPALIPNSIRQLQSPCLDIQTDGTCVGVAAGHRCACEECAQDLLPHSRKGRRLGTNLAICPLCRREVSEAVRIYL
jgi:hypothetical protein